jgi:hypothetical protein
VVKVLLFVLVVWSQIASAQTLGVAYFGMARFTQQQCDTALKVFDGVSVPALSTLWGSFGPSTKCLRQFLRQTRNRPTVLEIHGWNDTCHHSGRVCTKFDQPPARKRAKEIAQFLAASRHRNITVIVSTGLEDDSPPALYLARAKALKRYLPPSALIVRSPDDATKLFDYADFVEFHGLQHPRVKLPTIYSNDGLGINFEQQRRSGDNEILLSDLLRRVRKEGRNHSFIFWWWNTQGGEQFSVEPYRRSVVIRSQDVRIVNKLLREGL